MSLATYARSRGGATRTVSRLTRDDFAHIDERLTERIADLVRRTPGYRPEPWEWARLAHHAIGCTEWDLRDSELTLIGQQVHAICGHYGAAASPWPRMGDAS